VTREPEQPDTDSSQVEAFEPLPGELLIAAREKRGISPEAAAESLNLDVSVINALEDNRFEELGAPVFARGHLRKYAGLLDVDPKEVLRAYDAVAAERSAASLQVSPTVAESGPPRPRTWVKSVILIMAVLAVAVVLWRILSNGHQAVVNGGMEAPRPAADAAVSVQQAPVSESIPVPRPAPTPVTDIRPAVQIQEDVPDEPSRADPEPPVETAREVVVAQPPPHVPAGQSRVEFTFKRDSWLEVRDANGRRLAYEMGRGGRTRIVTGTAPLAVSLGYVAGVDITVDGKPFEIPASAVRGNTARFSIQASLD
jgi:cytoskeleton protein RodZ